MKLLLLGYVLGLWELVEVVGHLHIQHRGLVHRLPHSVRLFYAVLPRDIRGQQPRPFGLALRALSHRHYRLLLLVESRPLLFKRLRAFLFLQIFDFEDLLIIDFPL